MRWLVRGLVCGWVIGHAGLITKSGISRVCGTHRILYCTLKRPGVVEVVIILVIEVVVEVVVVIAWA